MPTAGPLTRSSACPKVGNATGLNRSSPTTFTKLWHSWAKPFTIRCRVLTLLPTSTAFQNNCSTAPGTYVCNSPLHRFSEEKAQAYANAISRQSRFLRAVPDWCASAKYRGQSWLLGSSAGLRWLENLDHLFFGSHADGLGWATDSHGIGPLPHR